MSDYLVTVRETFQTQFRVEANSQSHAKRVVIANLRRDPADPPSYRGDPDELPESIRLSAAYAWRDD